MKNLGNGRYLEHLHFLLTQGILSSVVWRKNSRVCLRLSALMNLYFHHLYILFFPLYMFLPHPSSSISHTLYQLPTAAPLVILYKFYLNISM
jgi:hypothetical protein